MAETEAAPPEVRATERWFIRQGLPMFVEEYSAGRDVWTRALPARALLFGVQTAGAVLVADTLRGGLLLVLACLLGLAAYAAWNLRHGRPAFALPARLGFGWLAAFVLVPAIASLAVSRDWASFAADLAVGVGLLLLVYVVSRYAVIALILWSVRWTLGQFSNVTRLITRVLPLLLLFITFLFINTEVWQVAGTRPASVLWGSLAVFGVVGLAYIVGRSREELGAIELTTDAGAVVRQVQGTPIGPVAADLPELGTPVPMHGRQRANLVAVLVTAQAVQVAFVGVVVWAFFVVFGALAISVPVQEAWLGSLAPVDVVLPLSQDHGVTRQLLRVATFLGGFAGFYATVYAASDGVYRQQFIERISSSVSRAIAVRRTYVALRRRESLPVDVPDALPEPDDDEL